MSTPDNSWGQGYSRGFDRGVPLGWKAGLERAIAEARKLMADDPLFAPTYGKLAVALRDAADRPPAA